MKRYGNQKRRGFTLIELMVSVGIIMMVVSVMFIGLNVARRQMAINRARTDVHNIRTAIVSYKQTYGRYPRQTGSGSIMYVRREFAELIDILMGQEDHSMNPKGIQFLEVSRGAYSESERTMVDPWGEPYRARVVVPDSTVVVWSQGDPNRVPREPITTE